MNEKGAASGSASRSGSSSRDDALPRVAALDGVRGLAILLVMIHHFTFLPKGPLADTAFYAVSKLGWTGVDLFFVLSGYLITTILIEYRGDGRYFSAFYARRALRILPLYYVVLVLTFFVLPAVVNLGSIKGSSLWFWLHASNLNMAFTGFSHKSLNVCWSLAIEEQFYLVWPLVVSLVPVRLLGRVSLGVFAASALLRVVLGLAGAKWITLYVFTPCRLDGLALGAFLATIPVATLRGSGKVATRVAIGALAVLAAMFALTRSTHLEGHGGDLTTGLPSLSRVGPAVGYAAFAVLWGAVLVLALSGDRTNKLFCSRPLVVLGKYSYGLYLIHLPVALFLRDSVLRPAEWPKVAGSLILGQLVFHVMAFAASLAIAWASWRALEEPILRLKKRFRYARM